MLKSGRHRFQVRIESHSHFRALDLSEVVEDVVVQSVRHRPRAQLWVAENIGFVATGALLMTD